MKVITFGIAILMVLVLPVTPSWAGWRFEKMLKEIEKKLPIAEKQAEAIVKMLNKEKHLAKIQADINKVGRLKYSEAYLYRVLKKIKVPFEKGAVDSKYLYGRQGTKMHILGPNFLAALTFGEFQYGRNDIYGGRERPKTEYAAKLVSICNRIMELQKPLQLVAREKIGSEIKKPSGWNSGDVGGSEFHNNRPQPYAFLLPAIEAGYDSTYKEFLSFNKKPSKYSDYPAEYLLYLKTLSQYFDEIEVKLSRGSIDWGDIIEKLDKLLAQKAEIGDLGDLMSDEGQESGEKNGEDLDIDGLKLPE